MEKETTLENFKGFTNKRRSGNTTRLVDHAIQIIHNGKICVVMDHFENGKNLETNKTLFRLILERLENEFDIHLVRHNLKLLEISISEIRIGDKISKGDVVEFLVENILTRDNTLLKGKVVEELQKNFFTIKSGEYFYFHTVKYDKIVRKLKQ